MARGLLDLAALGAAPDLAVDATSVRFARARTARELEQLARGDGTLSFARRALRGRR